MSDDALQQLIAPVSSDTFINNFWQMGPLHIERREADFFADVFSLDQFDSLYARSDLWHPNVRVFHSGKQVPLGQFNAVWDYMGRSHNRLVDKEKVLEWYRKGATINLLGLERMEPTLASISEAFEAQSGHRVQAKAFLSPRVSSNIPPHFDMSDVFVLQIAGEKQWNLWKPIRKWPLADDNAKRIFGKADPALNAENAIGKFSLSAGDSLYIPAGVIHEAVTLEQMSLHIAIGVSVIRWHDVFTAAMKHLLNDLQVIAGAGLDLNALQHEKNRLNDISRQLRGRLSDALAYELESWRGVSQLAAKPSSNCGFLYSKF